MEVTPEQKEAERELLRDLLTKCASKNTEEAVEAQSTFIEAIEQPTRQGIIEGDTVSGIYETDKRSNRNQQPRYPIDLFRLDNANDFKAFTCPSQGELPTKQVSGDYVMVQTYNVGHSIEIPLDYIRDADWAVVERAMEVFQAGFVQKRNSDGWHTILAAAADRNLAVADANASTGQFTKRLISLMKLVMRRNGGGNSTSINRRLLTHIYLSPEGIEDIRNWDATIVDEITRRDIYVNEGAVNRIYGVNLVDLDELGEGQDYQNYFTQILGGSLSGDLELVIGLNLANHKSFIHPVVEEVTSKMDPTAEKENLMRMYGRGNWGWAILDTANTLVGTF